MRRSRWKGCSGISAILLAASAQALNGQAAGGSASANGNGSKYPVSILARPATLPRGGSRLDAFVVVDRVPGVQTLGLGVLGGGAGITDNFEMGGQLVPTRLRPGVAYVNPSLYATYGFNIGSVSVAPQLQTVLPLQDDDPFFVDIGANASQNLGTLGQVLLTATFTADVRPTITGNTITIAPAIQRQAGERVNLQVTSTVALARVETRHNLSRRSDAFDFNEFIWAPSATVTYTLGRAAPHVLADFLVQWLWPQLYARGPDEPGWHAGQWALQLQTSIYFVR